MSEATLNSRERVTVPREIRKKLGLVAGDTLAFQRRSDGALILRVTRNALQDSTGAAARADRPKAVPRT